MVGTATSAGIDGVDMYMWRHGILPDYYISESEARKLGWRKILGNLAEVLPGRVIGGKIYLGITDCQSVREEFGVKQISIM